MTRMPRPLPRIALATTVLLLLGAGASFSALGRNPPAQPRAVTPRGALLPAEQSVVNLFDASAPSVAYITTESLQSDGWFGTEVTQGAGSGFVWDAQGHIVTNNHVVEGARRVYVQLDAGRPIEARIVGTSPEYDLAVIQLRQVPRGLKPIPLGSSHDLKIGQTVYAIGNPFGLS
ncbi:MAG: trypsin-like peptidase domain-containing protein, partial [Betaproteobacteria bacterium]|nr:trypsin-like peptidase domain-containing protein [Betaproteobacteria bacterium]